ncbi:putative F-box protein [Zea mays]|uniref:F-box domain containing protein expressed n=2 Tax=Zea mays TaxID=4577 RepID=B4FXK0_MAIZE|nr:uncharacterized protein LOC100273804 [Zea mays]XP_008658278.1 uncharacterized protein LOC100273804 isoform X1 [Zea mays]ACF86843.1 unknown [Zea mays]AQL04855.1 F-box domain containing protein expressed [Zea mays]PWZ06827.1 putative F-box protein [Zea mays]|eukprot:NP_001141678.1 uncharacterized protein LOC100273804 [Zea mays]
MESTAGPRKRQKAASASGSVAPYLPQELVRNILLRLPSRSVLRFRAVCKDWLRIVSDREFAADHNRHQPAMPLVSFLRSAAGSKRGQTDCCVDAFDLSADSFRSVVRFADKGTRCSSFDIHGSCDGLLLLSFDARFYVCNPATHQWTRLPAPLRASWLAGFYRHEPTGEYRALFYRGQWPGTDYYIMVADSRKGRGIGLPSEKYGYKFRRQPYSLPVLLRGHLHWMAAIEGYDYEMLAFNTTTEKFTVMCPPVVRWHMSLAEVGNELALLSCGHQVPMLELWILKDYENKSWVCTHWIRLPELKMSTFAFDDFSRMIFVSEKGVLIATPEQKLLRYDLNGTLLESFPCNNGSHLKITPYTFKESLVRHAFFETPDCNADGHEDEDEPEPPPFFLGL